MVSNGTRNANDDVHVDVEVKRLVELYGLRACRRSLDKLFAREEEEEKLAIGNNNKIRVVRNHELEQPAATGGGGGSSVQRQKDELTAAIMDASVDAICTVDARGTIRSANRAAETSFGYQVGELVGHNIESILVRNNQGGQSHEDMLSSGSINGSISSGSGIKALHETCKGNSREVLARKKNGTEFPALLRIQRVCESSTIINGDIDAATNISHSDVNDDLDADSSSLYVTLIRDWSERSRVLRQLESQSALSENLKTAFLDASPDAIFAVCPVGNIVSVNRAGMKMFGYRSESEIVGHNIETIVAEEAQGQEASEKEIFMELFRAESEQPPPTLTEGEEESETSDGASSATAAAGPCRACQVGCKHELQCRRKNHSQFPAIVGVQRVEPFLFAFVRDTSEEQKARELEVSVRSADELLHNLLPDEIIERLKADPSHLADQHDNAPILFADIVGFTAMSSKMNPLELVHVLNDLFTRFDGLVEDYGLNKVKTIGDCYMVTSIPRRSDPRKACRAMCHFALDMLQALQEFNDEQQTHQTAGARGGEEEEKEEQNQQQQEHQEPLGLRVGINCGTVVAGVVGTNRFLYDLWGDAVNVASRMESTGVPLRIQVTKAVVDQVPPGEFDFEARGAIEVKGKGSMETYFLDKKKPSRTRDRNLLLRSLQENFTEPLSTLSSSHDSRFRASTIERLTRPRGLMSLLLGSRRRPSELTRSVRAQQPLKRFASDGHGECSESYRKFIATMNGDH